MKRVWMLLLAVLAVALGAAAYWNQRGTVRILMYHHLVADGGETNSMTVTAGKFRRDIEYLCTNGYITLLPEELSEVLRSKRACPERAVVISFDDGYASNYEIAYPILKEYGCKAVISLITSNIGEAKEEGAFMLCWPEVGEMSASGLVAFGSHSDNLHNPDIGGALRKGPDAVNGVERFPDETWAEYRERVGSDLARSCELVESHTGIPVSWFAYPYGAGDRWCEKLLDGLDVQISVSTEPGKSLGGCGTRDLPRYGIHEDTAIESILPA